MCFDLNVPCGSSVYHSRTLEGPWLLGALARLASLPIGELLTGVHNNIIMNPWLLTGELLWDLVTVSKCSFGPEVLIRSYCTKESAHSCNSGILAILQSVFFSPYGGVSGMYSPGAPPFMEALLG